MTTTALFPPFAIERALRREELGRRTAALIADCGQPQWPGWQFIAVLLVAAQIAVLLTLHNEPLRVRPRDLRTRVSEVEANAVRRLAEAA